MKKFKIRNFITASLCIIVIVMIAAYSALVKFALHSVSIDHLTYDLELPARDFSIEYKKDPNTPLPQDKYLKSYLGSEHLPEWFTSIHKPETLKEHKVRHGNISDEKIHNGENFFYMAIKYPLHDQKELFLIATITKTDDLPNSFKNLSRTEIMTFAMGCWFILLIGLLITYLFRRISKPIQTLTFWANNLNKNSLKETHPDFQFDEINQIANFIQNSTIDLQDALDREHQFLRYASHELRTPITVINTNIDLLDRIGSPTNPVEKQSYNRIRKAAENMRCLTETLLWMSRKEESMPGPESFQIEEMTAELINNYKHLLTEKNIQLQTTFVKKKVYLPKTAFRIALENLIRNAFQHTPEGHIQIVLSDEQITIENTVSEQSRKEESQGENNNFGLGLMLVQQICDKLNINYQRKTGPDGYISCLSLVTENERQSNDLN